MTHISSQRKICAIGNFDGVHRGHQYIFSRTQALGLENGWLPGLITFHPHPRDVLTHAPDQRRLTPLAQKLTLVQRYGVAWAHVVAFTRPMAALTPQAFVEDVLLKIADIQHVVVGEDFRFGRQRTGSVDTLKELGRQFGFGVTGIPMQSLSILSRATFNESSREDVVSSRRIIAALKEGDLPSASHMLGRVYGVMGKVSEGHKRGRTLGFPTANLVCEDFVMPKRGVYAVTCHVGGKQEGADSPEAHSLLYGVANLGVRPTFGGEEQETLEVHLFDFEGDLYGQCLQVFFHTFLRPEMKFSSVEALVAQIQQDCIEGRAALSKDQVF